MDGVMDLCAGFGRGAGVGGALELSGGRGMRRAMGLRLKRRVAWVMVLGAMGVAGLRAGGAAVAQNAVDMKPNPQQSAWQDLEFGVIIHFGPNTFLNQEWGDGTASPKVFDLMAFDPDQWMKAVKAAGAKYVVMVAKHHDGFCLWPTGQTKYSVVRAQ